MIEGEKYRNKGSSGPSGTKPKAEIRDNQQDISFFPTKKSLQETIHFQSQNDLE